MYSKMEELITAYKNHTHKVQISYSHAYLSAFF